VFGERSVVVGDGGEGHPGEEREAGDYVGERWVEQMPVSVNVLWL